MGNTRRVAIVGPLWHLSISPSVISSIKMWIRNNYLVDYIAMELGTPEHKSFSVFKDEKMRTYNVKMRRIGVPLLGGLIHLLGPTWHSFRYLRGKKHDCFIGIDRHGFIVATVLGILLRTPVVYHSLELYLSRYDDTFGKKLLKMIERWCNKRAVYTIIQDEVRAKHLIEDNRIPSEKVLIIPHTYLKEGEIIKNNYLREKYSINGDKKIILHVGALNWYNMVPELIDSVSTWPENCILVLHGWVWKGAGREESINHLKELAEKRGLYNKRILISTDVLQQEDFDKMVSSADIGMALYHNVDLNYYNIASGKLFQYLKCGLPVIAINFPNMREIVEENHCGICVNNEGEIAEAIRKILSNYEVFSSNALKCFEEKYEFSRFYQDVIKKVTELEDNNKGIYLPHSPAL